MAGLSEANVKQFSSNVYHLIQQKGSKFINLITKKDVSKEEGFFNKLGYSTAQELTGVFSDVNYTELSHAVRSITWKTWYNAVPVDSIQKLKTIINPASEYSIEMKTAMQRKMDDIIIENILGPVQGGKTGAQAPINLEDKHKRAAVDESATINMLMTPETLRIIRRYFRENDNDDETINLSLTAAGIDNLLGSDKLTSSDYNTVKALVNGDVDNFMGINFVKSQRLLKFNYVTTTGTRWLDPNDGGYSDTDPGAYTEFPTGVYRECFAWQKSGVYYTQPEAMFTRVSELPVKHYSHQIYCRMKMGISRIEEEKVLKLFVREDSAVNPIDVRVGTGPIN